MTRPVPPIPDTPLYRAAEAVAAAAGPLAGDSMILRAHLRYGNAGSVLDYLVKVVGEIDAIQAASADIREALIAHAAEKERAT